MVLISKSVNNITADLRDIFQLGIFVLRDTLVGLVMDVDWKGGAELVLYIKSVLHVVASNDLC